MPTPRDEPLPSSADQPAAWRGLALTLAASLARSQRARTAEQAAERASFERQLLHDREDFLGLVAHELKTPVAVIKAYAELLEAQLVDRPLSRARRGTMRQVVAHILEQAEVISTLVEDVLDVQRLRLGKLPLEVSRLDLVELARRVAEEVGQTAPMHTIRVVTANPPPPLRGDRRRLRQVLTNLLENAVKYSAGGEIEVRVNAEQRDGRRGVLVAIRDQGVGIDPADLERIFDQFTQAAAAPGRGRAGLGLGLYVARQIAQAHGGHVWAESSGTGRGSTFYLELPLDLDPGARGPVGGWDVRGRG